MKPWKQHSYIFSSRRNEEPFLEICWVTAAVTAAFQHPTVQPCRQESAFYCAGSFQIYNKQLLKMWWMNVKQKQRGPVINICVRSPSPTTAPWLRRWQRSMCIVPKPHNYIETWSWLLLCNLSQKRKQQCCQCWPADLWGNGVHCLHWNVLKLKPSQVKMTKSIKRLQVRWCSDAVGTTDAPHCH